MDMTLERAQRLRAERAATLALQGIPAPSAPSTSNLPPAVQQAVAQAQQRAIQFMSSAAASHQQQQLLQQQQQHQKPEQAQQQASHSSGSGVGVYLPAHPGSTKRNSKWDDDRGLSKKPR